MAERQETALILGAGHGLGAAIAAECQRRGWRTMEAARFRGTGTAAEAAAEAHDIAVVRDPRVVDDTRATITCNLGYSGGLLAPFQHLYGQGWRPTRFFWVAGQWWEGPFDTMDLDTLVRLLDVNLRNELAICHGVWRQFVESAEQRSFVTIGSTSGLAPKPNQAIYAATKFAQVGFTRELGAEAQRLRRDGRVRRHNSSECSAPDIRVALFNPGGMRTNLFDANPPANLATFMNPTKVAAHIVNRIAAQTESFIEETIERASALGASLR